MMPDATLTVRTLSEVTDWVFDLDNTLYPRACNLWAEIDRNITRYVMDVTRLDFEAARSLQKGYYRDFGTTLNGLMQRHSIDPDHFLTTVHAIDYSPVAAHPELVAAIATLPGRKFILTNADTGHAEAVLGRLGCPDLFDGVFDIKAMNYVPKPNASAYAGFLERHGIDPTHAVMFDDLEKNLVVPHANGMATVQVIAEAGFVDEDVEAWELQHEPQPHVQYLTDDLVGFLRNLP